MLRQLLRHIPASVSLKQAGIHTEGDGHSIVVHRR
jgi:hypothetical protein